MSETPMKLVADIATGITSLIPLTAEELQQRELDAIQAATNQAEREAEAQRIEALKASAKAKLISGQPMTEEEAGLLII